MSFVPVAPDAELHLRHFAPPKEQGTPRHFPVLMVHGAIENGRIFYSRSEKGLAPYLSARGFDVHVLDLRGRGESRPKVGPNSEHGQWESIVEDIPAASDFLLERTSHERQHWVAHSWGGVLLIATLARRPEYRERVASLTLFGTKRSIRVWNPTRLLYIDLVWFGLCPLLCRLYGYLAAKNWRLGSDDEPRRSYEEEAVWVRPGPWIDPRDGFDYRAALVDARLPPILSLAGRRDPALGHPSDCRDFLQECGVGEKCFRLLAKQEGFAHDYGHVDMLTSTSAARELFPVVLNWLVGAEAEG